MPHTLKKHIMIQIGDQAPPPAGRVTYHWPSTALSHDVDIDWDQDFGPDGGWCVKESGPQEGEFPWEGRADTVNGAILDFWRSRFGISG